MFEPGTKTKAGGVSKRSRSNTLGSLRRCGRLSLVVRSAWSSLTMEPLSSAAKGMLLFGCDRILASRQAQVALKNAKQRIARRYLAALQILEDCGQCSRLRLRIDGVSQVLILRKFCLTLLLNRFEFRLQDSQCFKFMHDGYPCAAPWNYLTKLLWDPGGCASGHERTGWRPRHNASATLAHLSAAAVTGCCSSMATPIFTSLRLSRTVRQRRWSLRSPQAAGQRS